jgi:hypothetical protein
MRTTLLALGCCVLLAGSIAQDHAHFYEEYARNAVRRRNNNNRCVFEHSISFVIPRVRWDRRGYVATVVGALLGFVSGQWIASSRARSKHQKEMEDFVHHMMLEKENLMRTKDYTIEQLQYFLKQAQYRAESAENAYHDLKYATEQEQMERDYEEFKQPDVDHDDLISRAEVR